MITEEQAREAAERLRAAAVAFKDCEDDDPRLTEIEWAIEGNEQMLVTFAREELSRRDAERAERALPITAEWLESMGFDDGGSWLVMKYNGGKVYVGKGRLYVYVNATPMHTITKRGQLGDLINALRGGAT